MIINSHQEQPSLAYYNEIDPVAAQWLRNLIAAGHIAPGVVDTRSIEDVQPDDLREFTQCHFFAGVGVWSLALRRAGWSDDRPVWTGSCPCQPFSAAGKGAAFDDERHLWPAFHHLITQCKPPVVLGEQVASAAVDAWIDLVHADLEALGYAFGSVPFPSAGVGAPHIRDRNYWVAHADSSTGRQGRAHVRGRVDGSDAQSRAGSGGSGLLNGLADANQHGRGAHAGAGVHDTQHYAEPRSGVRGLADAVRARPLPGAHAGIHRGEEGSGPWDGEPERSGAASEERPGPTNGFWRDADWLGCRDGKWRPVEPGTFPLAHGASARVGRLRAYGNAINAEAARIWIETVMEAA